MSKCQFWPVVAYDQSLQVLNVQLYMSHKVLKGVEFMFLFRAGVWPSFPLTLGLNC